MGNIPLAFVMLAGSLLAFTDLPQQVKQIVDDTILTGQQIATAGDLRSLSTMLDVHYLKRGIYPAEERFGEWLAVTFKENDLKELSQDHWGNSFQYAVSTGRKAYSLSSSGADGIFGTSDDMKVTGP
jgi:general secretion pathway protein G